MKRVGHYWQSPKSNQKAGAERGASSPALLVEAGLLRQYFGRYASSYASKARPTPSLATALGGARCASTHLASSASPLYCFASAVIHHRAPAGCSRLACDARHRGRRPLSTKPSIHGLRQGKCFALALARTMRADGAPVVRRGCEGKAAGWRAGSAPVRYMFMDEHSTNSVAPSRNRKAGDGMDAGGRTTQEQLPEAQRPHHRGPVSAHPARQSKDACLGAVHGWTDLWITGAVRGAEHRRRGGTSPKGRGDGSPRLRSSTGTYCLSNHASMRSAGDFVAQDAPQNTALGA